MKERPSVSSAIRIRSRPSTTDVQPPVVELLEHLDHSGRQPISACHRRRPRTRPNSPLLEAFAYELAVAWLEDVQRRLLAGTGRG
jgi:hypothetical protein